MAPVVSAPEKPTPAVENVSNSRRAVSALLRLASSRSATMRSRSSAASVRFFFFRSYSHPPDLHSFPTRRSSDLEILRPEAPGSEVTRPNDANIYRGDPVVNYDPAFIEPFSTETSTGRMGLAGWTSPVGGDNEIGRAHV